MAALALHVADEALNGFLPIYNRTALSLQERFIVGPPTFTFPVWMGGLAAGISIGFLLTPWMARRGRWARVFAAVFSALMILNAIGHFAGSLALGRPMPGAWSSPLLLLAAIWVFRIALDGGSTRSTDQATAQSTRRARTARSRSG